MYPSVTNVIPLDNYLLSVEFSNGEKGVLDMKPYLDFGVFTRLKEQTSFNQVRVSFDTIEWHTGADLDPEFVYKKCQRSTAHPSAAADA
ncbi:hypothetical protein LCGC14_0038130 [marine sediment metagenome]|uniref:DUF2442 domain-containing protein n=1 Tax=marine sediment metagenome TaxID=412755 RepID=A0A0F9VWQ2_9ZZZZ|nr:DUF2442 domain-containing protein [Halomonas sp.]HDZ48662.1 DUF2442 domain-containing protein [Halomonas sp.]HEB05632.1 DUF2442 domain-containing protein [Halomonas sp.]